MAKQNEVPKEQEINKGHVIALAGEHTMIQMISQMDSLSIYDLRFALRHINTIFLRAIRKQWGDEALEGSIEYLIKVIETEFGNKGNGQKN